MPGSPIVYPGTNPPTVSTTPGAGAPGVIVNSGSSTGLFTNPLVVQGNNDVTADNVATADQAEQDSINWLAWRTIDWIFGGIYTWVATVQLANFFTFVNKLTVRGQGTDLGLDVVGGAAGMNLSAGAGGSGNNYGLLVEGVGTGAGVISQGGASGGAGISATAQGGNSPGSIGVGHGSGPGGSFTGGATANTPDVLCNAGPIQMVTACPTPSANNGPGLLWADNIPKAQALISV